MAVARRKISVFLCQLLGFQAEPRQRGSYDKLIPRWSFSSDRKRRIGQKLHRKLLKYTEFTNIDLKMSHTVPHNAAHK